MSLDWHLEGIENHQTTCWIETDEKNANGDPLVRMNPVTYVLTRATISVKLGAITEKNAPDFYARLHVCEKVLGPFLLGPGGAERFITPEEVHAHIGLVVNVRSETRARFLSGLKADLERLEGVYSRELEKITC